MSDGELDEIDKVLQREEAAKLQESETRSNNPINEDQEHKVSIDSEKEPVSKDHSEAETSAQGNPESSKQSSENVSENDSLKNETSDADTSASDSSDEDSSLDTDSSDSESSGDDSDSDGDTNNEPEGLQDSDNEPSEIPHTRNEILEDEIPQFPTDLVITDSTPLEPIGTIKAVGERSVVIEANNSARYRVLADGAALVLDGQEKERIPIGILYETFGPVDKPFYVVKFKDNESLEPFKSKVGENVSQVVSTAHYVLTDEFKSKGTDASNFNDEEVPLEEQEFSDDEQEMLAKMTKNKKRKKSKKQSTDPRPPNPKQANLDQNNPDQTNSGQSISDLHARVASSVKPSNSSRPPVSFVPSMTPPAAFPQNMAYSAPVPPPAPPTSMPMAMTPEMMQQWYQFQQFQQYQYQQSQYQQMYQQQQQQQQKQQQQQQQQQQQPPPPPPY